MPERRSRGIRWQTLAAHVLLTAYGFFYVFPFLWMLSGSLKTSSEFLERGINLLPQHWVWSNYQEAWSAARFDVYFKNSVFVSLMASLIVIVITSLAGYALARSSFPGKFLIIGLIALTMFLPKGYTIIPIFNLVKDLGLLNTLWSVILVNAGTSVVFNTFLFVGYFTTLPKELEEAAALDGANRIAIYWRIALPLARPMIATVGLFEFLDNWNGFFIPLVFTLGQPDLRTLAVGIYAYSDRNWPVLSAAATLSVLPTLVLFFLLQRLFVTGLAGAMRG